MVIVALLVALAGCSRDTGTPTPAGGTAAPAGPVDLRAVCPAKIVIQDAWWPSMSEHG